MALAYGFGVYYLLPLSLVSFNFSLATTIFFGILFGMMMALGLLSMNLMPYINSIVATIALIFEKSGTKLLVSKNLIAHRERNQMTSIMISLSLGFVMFLNIVGQIPFARDMHNAVQDMGRNSLMIDRYNLPMY